MNIRRTRSTPTPIAATCAAALLAGAAPNPTDNAPTDNLDILTRTGGTVQRGRVLGLDHERLRFQITVVPGRPPAVVSIPRTDVRRVQFAPRPDEQAIAGHGATAEAHALRASWFAWRPYIDLPEARAGAVGLALASHLATPDTNLALAILDEIARRDWDASRQAAAVRLRLLTLIRAGRARDALADATILAERTDDAEPLLEARLALGLDTARALRQLETEHPRWEREPEIAAQRRQHIAEATDHLLFPFLAHGTRAPQAARGLEAAARFAREHGDAARSIEWLRDIAEIYPDQPGAAWARQELEPGEETKPHTGEEKQK